MFVFVFNKHVRVSELTLLMAAVVGSGGVNMSDAQHPYTQKKVTVKAGQIKIIPASDPKQEKTSKIMKTASRNMKIL